MSTPDTCRYFSSITNDKDYCLHVQKAQSFVDKHQLAKEGVLTLLTLKVRHLKV